MKMKLLTVFSLLLHVFPLFLSHSANRTKDQPPVISSSFVILSQNTTISFSDDLHCNAVIKDQVQFELSNGQFSVLTRKISLKPNIEDFRNFVITSKFLFFLRFLILSHSELVIIVTDIIRGCNDTLTPVFSEICVTVVFEFVNAVDSSITVWINYQYEAVSMLKSEVKPLSRNKFNSLAFTLDNQNNYHLNNINVTFIFDLFKRPEVNLTWISPSDYELSSDEHGVLAIGFSFFEIRNEESWEMDVKFNEIVHGCADAKSAVFNGDKDGGYITLTWVIVLLFLFLLMLILYCGEITNLNKKVK